MPASCILRIALQPTFETRAEIAQGKRLRRAIGEIGPREPMEGPLSKHGAQPRKIVTERIEPAKPIAAAVDFQALDGSEAVVRPDKFGDLNSHRPAIPCFQRDSIGTR